MPSIKSSLTLYLTLCLSTLISCTGNKLPSNDIAVSTITVERPSYTIKHPEYVFLNEPFDYQIIADGVVFDKTHTFVTRTNFAVDCCELRAYEQGAVEVVKIPTYSQVLDAGPPLTLQAAHSHTLAVDINNDFLEAVGDSVLGVEWSQAEGGGSFSQNQTQITFTPALSDQIERSVFTAKLTTTLGRTFSTQKVIFTVPDGDWLDVELIEETSLMVVAQRSDKSLFYSDSAMQNYQYFDASNIDIKLITGFGDRAYLVDQTNQLSYLDKNNELTAVDRDFDDIVSLTSVVSVRGTLLIINRTGEMFGSRSEFEKIDDGIAAVAPSIFAEPVLTLDGDLRTSTEVLASNVLSMDGAIYLTEAGELGSTDLKAEQDLSRFSEFSDYITIESEATAIELTSPDRAIFAKRMNGDMISNVRLPPDIALHDINLISAGSNGRSALTKGGLVIRWENNLTPSSRNKVLQGEVPSPMHITQQAFEQYIANHPTN